MFDKSSVSISNYTNIFFYNLIKNNIPKVIYMCYKKLDKIKIYSKNWKKLNPEYEIKLYDDELCKEFLLNEYSQLHLDIFNFLQDGPIKADFWRICIINKYGGLYVDADIEPLVPLKNYISDSDTFMTCISGNFNKNRLEYQLNPHIILSNKNNIFLQNSINRYIKAYNKNKPYSYWDWSICKLFTIDGIEKKESQILFKHGEKIKLLLEKNDFNSCEYNGKIVLHNRYDNYKNHDFID